MRKKLFSLALALALCLGLTVPAFAAELKIVQVPVPTVEEYKGKVDYGTWEFHEGLAKLWLYEDSSGSPTGTGFIDWTGKVVVPAKYDGAGDFTEGFAAVWKNDKVGFIDKTGKEVVPVSYDMAQNFSEGFAAVMKNNKIGFVDKTGKEVIPCAYSNSAAGFSEGLAAVEKGGKWGFIDKTGKEAIPFQYDTVYSFSEGLAVVEKNGKMGYIDKTGQEAFPCQYDYVYSFSDGLAMVAKNNKGGYIDKTGKEVIPPQYDFSKEFCNGLAPVMKNNKWGFINKNGELVVPFQYDDAAPFSEGFAWVVKSGNGGFIDKTGKEVVEPKTYTENGKEYSFGIAIYKTLPSFSDGYAYARRWYTDTSHNIPSETEFYFALTVDAKVADWAREQVDLAAAKGLMPDCFGDDFTVNITRAEFAALSVALYEAMSGEAAPVPGENPFTDADDPAILQANALGVVKGKGDGKFAPDDLVTRQEAALMLSRVYTKLGGEIPQVAATTFADDSEISDWAGLKDAIAFMAGHQILNGVGNNRFDPKGNASVQEAMVIALRMFENLK